MKRKDRKHQMERWSVGACLFMALSGVGVTRVHFFS